MEHLARFFSIALAIGVLFGETTGQATEPAQPPSVHCRAQNSDGSLVWSFEISEVGENMILRPGIYLSFFRNAPWSRSVTIFRVRSDNNSAMDLLRRVEALNQRRSNGDYSSGLSLSGIRFSAVGIDAATTINNRGDQALIVEGSEIRIGDSFHSESDYALGKYMGADIHNCF